MKIIAPIVIYIREIMKSKHSRRMQTRHYEEILNVIKTASKGIPTNTIYNVKDGINVALIAIS
jgi:hypothetical protein